MKKNKLLILSSIVFLSTCWSSCGEDDQEDQPDPVLFTAQEIDGSYRIISFIEDNNEIVNQFGSNIVIEISSNKDIFFPNTANYGGWEFGDATGEIDIDIIVGDSPYSEFDNDWVVVKLENNELWLYDDDFFDDEPDDDDDNEQVKLQKQD